MDLQRTLNKNTESIIMAAKLNASEQSGEKKQQIKVGNCSPKRNIKTEITGLQFTGCIQVIWVKPCMEN